VKRKLTIFLFLVCGIKTPAKKSSIWCHKKFLWKLFSISLNLHARKARVCMSVSYVILNGNCLMCVILTEEENFHKKQWLWILWLLWSKKNEQLAAFEEELIKKFCGFRWNFFWWFQWIFCVEMCSNLWLVICKDSCSSINLMLFSAWFEFYSYAQLLTSMLWKCY